MWCDYEKLPYDEIEAKIKEDGVKAKERQEQLNLLINDDNFVDFILDIVNFLEEEKNIA